MAAPQPTEVQMQGMQYAPPGTVPMQYAPPQGQPTYTQQPGQPMYMPQPGQPMPQQPMPQAVAVGPLVAGGQPPPTAPGATVIGDPMIDGLLFFPVLYVKQKPRGAFLEYMFGWESENKYKIYNPLGPTPKQEMLIAMEDSTCMCRQCCGAMREFRMPVTTADGKEVLVMKRPFHCGRKGCLCCCACDSCFQSIECWSGKQCQQPDKLVGRVKELYSYWVPKLSVRDENDHEIYRIIGDCCILWSYELHIYPANAGPETPSIGKIKKKWSGLGKELFTDADNFVVEFPQNASGKERMLLLTALFFIDFLFFENNQQQGQRNGIGF